MVLLDSLGVVLLDSLEVACLVVVLRSLGEASDHVRTVAPGEASDLVRTVEAACSVGIGSNRGTSF